MCCAMASSFCTDKRFVRGFLTAEELQDLFTVVDLNTDCIYYLLEHGKMTFAEGILSCRLDQGQVG